MTGETPEVRSDKRRTAATAEATAAASAAATATAAETKAVATGSSGFRVIRVIIASIQKVGGIMYNSTP